MMSLFAPSANDQSLVYLYNIFGSMNGVIPAPGGGATPTTMLTLLGSMFKTFNTIILAVGALIVVYVTIVGVMNTAHEGEFMGKKWNNLWLPIRTVLGIAALVPTGSGYSGLQIVMMWVIIQGIGAADTLWGTALSFINTTGSPFAQITLPSTQAKQSIAGLFQGIMCAKSAAANSPKVADKGKGDEGAYYCAINPNKDFCRSINSATFAPAFSDKNETQYQLGPGSGGCGVLTYCNQATSCAAIDGDSTSGPQSLKCLSCMAQLTALKAIIPTFASIADNYLSIDTTYQQYYYSTKVITPKSPKQQVPSFIQSYCTEKNKTPCIAKNLLSPAGDFMSAPADVLEEVYWPYGLKPLVGDKSFVQTAINFYIDGMGSAVNTFLLAQATDSSVALKGPLQKARDTGWILAGSYYHALAKMNASNLSSATPSLLFEIKTENMPEASGSPLYGYRNNYKAAGRLMCLAAGTTCGNESQQMSDVMASGAGDTNNSFSTLISNQGNTDPLAQLTATGQTLLLVASILMIVFVVVVIVMAIVSAINIMILGSGMPMSPAFPVTLELLMLFIPLFFMFVGFLITIGGLLGVYVPLIPYIIFTVGAIGWMISTIEAMVAGPLVALGILSPSGQHEVLGKAEPALGMLFAIFLRPSLMIFGMMAAMLLSSAVVMMINAGFSTVKENIFSSGVANNPVSVILVLVAYVNLIVVALNKTFSTIYIIPERTLSWISINVPQEGAGDALGEMKGGISAGSSGISDAGKTGGSAGSENLGRNKKSFNKANKAAQKRADENNNPDVT